MYLLTLSLHNILRWVALILGVIALLRAYMGWFGGRPWTETDRKAGTFFGIALDIQFLLGLILYIFLSPLTREAFSNFGAAMANADLRFYALEHAFYMFLALVFVHMGSVLARRQVEDGKKHRTGAIFYTLAFLVILLAMPWSRPLFRLPF